MSATLLALAVGLVQGLVHGLGPDHCAAIATLGTSTDEHGNPKAARLRTLWIAVRFAIGHALMLGMVALICVAAGVGLSEAFEKWAEVAGGAVLIALAISALFFPSVLRHGHPHLPGHGHSHVHPPAERSARVSTAAGALMAVSGARSLLIALPPLMVGGALKLSAWAYLPGFAVGILVSMGVVGVIVAEGAARLGDRLRQGVALASGLIGIWWIVARI